MFFGYGMTRDDMGNSDGFLMKQHLQSLGLCDGDDIVKNIGDLTESDVFGRPV